MELAETRTTHTESADEVKAIREAIKGLLEKEPKGGEITLNDFCKLLGKDVNRSEVVRILKKGNEGVFVTGRRGKKSRFQYGMYAVPRMAPVAAKHNGKHAKGRPGFRPSAPVAQFEGASLELEVETPFGTIKVPGKVVSLAAA